MQTIKNKSVKFWTISSLSATLLIMICVLTYVNMREVISGVKINAEIKNSDEKSFSKISGFAKNATLLVLNGREISVDKNGAFNEAIALPDGYSVVTIEAKDQFGKSSKKAFEVYTVNSKSVAVANVNKNIINN